MAIILICDVICRTSSNPLSWVSIFSIRKYYHAPTFRCKSVDLVNHAWYIIHSKGASQKNMQPIPNNRALVVTERIVHALQDAAERNSRLDRLRMYVEMQSTPAYELLVTYETIPPASSNRSFYEQRRIPLIRIRVDTSQSPAITLQECAVLYGG